MENKRHKFPNFRDIRSSRQVSKKKKEHFTEQPDLDQGMQGIDDSVILAQIAAIIGAIASITQSNHD
jgi:hypothetical protein